jgi:hypothetical protein
MTSGPDIEAFAREPLDEEDLELLSALGDVLRTVDPVPDDLAQRSQFAMTVAALEADVARIVDQEMSESVRAGDYDVASSITFAGEGLTAMVTIEGVGRDRASLHGWLTTPGAEVELRERSRTRVVTADHEGRFTLEGVTRGLVHIVIRPAEQGAKPVITPTFEV